MPKGKRIDEPGYALALAELLSSGLTNAEVAETMPDQPSVDSVKRWAKSPQVQAHLTRLREERVNRVTRRIDAQLESRISDPKQLAQLDVKDLITIRRELLGPQPQRIVASRGVDEADALADVYARLSANPELAEALGMEGMSAPDADEDEPAQLEGGELLGRGHAEEVPDIWPADEKNGDWAVLEDWENEGGAGDGLSP